MNRDEETLHTNVYSGSILVLRIREIQDILDDSNIERTRASFSG